MSKFDQLYHTLQLTKETYYQKLKRDLVCQTIGNYLIQKEIGHKGEKRKSRVYKAINTLNKEQIVALKSIEIDQKLNQELQKQQLEFLRRESDLMMEGHKNILKCHQVYQNDFLKIMVLDYCESNLQEQISRGAFKQEKDIFLAAEQILTGINVLQSRKILHRDLKFTGILYHQGKYFISDIGIHNRIVRQREFINRKVQGFYLTTPKQIQRYLNTGTKELALGSDIWSVGALIYCMAFPVKNRKSLGLPYMDISFPLLSKKLTDNSKTLSSSLSILIKAMMKQELMYRPSSQFLLRIFQEKEHRESNFEQAFTKQAFERFIEPPKKQVGFHLKQLKQVNKELQRNFIQKCRQYAKANFLFHKLFNNVTLRFVFNLNHQKTKQFLCLLLLRCKNDLKELAEFLQSQGKYDSQVSQLASACMVDEKRMKQVGNNYFNSHDQKEVMAALSHLRKNVGKRQSNKEGQYSREEQIELMLSLIPDVVTSMKGYEKDTQKVKLILGLMDRLFKLDETELKWLTVRQYIGKNFRV